MRIAIRRLLLISNCLALYGQAPTPKPLTQGTPFNIIGLIEEFTLINPADPTTGAKMTVNGISVNIPANLSIVMPGRYMTPFQVFVNNPKNLFNLNDPMNPNQADSTPPDKNKPDPAQGSGLAKKDPAPLGAYQADIQGNIVETPPGTFDYRAGIVHISQLALNTASGYINFIDPATRSMRVGGSVGSATTGARVRLNDPKGRYGAPTSHDVRFTSDDSNPPIRAITGYPMCMPRPISLDDPECPVKNRPALLPNLAVIRMNHTDPTTPPDGVPACAGCDPKKQAPFRVGDYITYQGVRAEDADGVYISVYSVTAWVAIFTKPGTWPVYVNQEVSLIGTGGVNYPGIAIEFGPGKAALGIINTRLKVVGFTTDPTRNVKFFRMDRGVCGGPNTPVFLASAVKEEAPLGRFRGQIDRRSFTPVPYELRVQVSPLNAVSGSPEQIPVSDPAVARGIIPGIFDAPVGEYLFPENKAAGAQLVPLNLEDFPYLRGGLGASAAVLQLNPWPGVGPWPSATAARPDGTPVPKPCP